jgi:hypothetical protein
MEMFPVLPDVPSRLEINDHGLTNGNVFGRGIVVQLLVELLVKVAPLLLAFDSESSALVEVSFEVVTAEDFKNVVSYFLAIAGALSNEAQHRSEKVLGG